MKVFLGVFVSVFLVFCCVGCQTTQQVLASYERDLSKGAYLEGAKAVRREAEKENEDQLLWRLLAGNAYLLGNSSQEAIDQLDRAEDLFLQNDSQSVFSRGLDEAEGMLGNDTCFDYNGIGQDRIFCCLYKAIEYASRGETGAARTEFNRAAEHQENWLFERRKDIAAAAERLAADAANQPEEKKLKDADPRAQTNEVLQDAGLRSEILAHCDYDVSTSGVLENLPTSAYTNAYLAHITGIFRWINGDGARGYLRDAARQCPGNAVVARDFQEIESGARPREQVWVYVEDGLCPCREEWRLDLPLFFLPGLNRYVLYGGMALPTLRYRDCAADCFFVGVPGEHLDDIPVLEDMDRLLKTEYDVYMRGAVPREIARAILKVSAQVALGIAADNTGSDGTRTSLRIAQFGAAAWARSTTEADVRCWTGLPKQVRMLRLDRPADGYLVVVAANPGTQEELRVAIPPGNTILWIRKVSRRSPMVAKVITYQ